MRLLITALAFLISFSVFGQIHSSELNFSKIGVLYGSDESVQSHHPVVNPLLVSVDNRAAVFITELDPNIPFVAIEAIQYTLGILSNNIISDYPIKIKFDWLDQEPGLLASAGPTSFESNFENIPLPLFTYPVALAENICQCSLNGSEAESISNRYFIV